MTRIKHIAIRTRDIEKTAAFYKEAFGLKQVGLGQNGIYLTDGHLNIAILKFQRGKDGEPLRLVPAPSVPAAWLTKEMDPMETQYSAESVYRHHVETRRALTQPR